MRSVLAGHEIAGHIGGPSLVERFERPKRDVIFEHDNGGGHGGVKHGSRHQLRKSAVKELEPHSHLPQIFFTRVTDKEQVIRVNAPPRVSRLSGVRT